MFFHIKRYYFGLLNYRSWLWLAIFLPFLYLAISMITPNQFSITQDIRVSKNTPVALITSPVGYISMKELLSRPETLFQNRLSIRALYGKIYSDIEYYRTDQDFRSLFVAAKNFMSLYKNSNGKIQVIYQGPEKEKGLMMVEFYSERLIQNATEGLRRSKATGGNAPKLAGAVKIKEQRVLFEASRMWMFLKVLVLSIIGVLVFCGILEYRDSSFKSERQMARYLGVPILGSIPDLNKVYASMERS